MDLDFQTRDQQLIQTRLLDKLVEKAAVQQQHLNVHLKRLFINDVITSRVKDGKDTSPWLSMLIFSHNTKTLT